MKKLLLVATVTLLLAASAFAQVPSFTLSTPSSRLDVLQAASVTSTVSVTGQNGFNKSVSLAATGLPSGLTASFTPETTTKTSKVTLIASGSAPAGIHPLLITGISGSLTKSATVGLLVVASNVEGVLAFLDETSKTFKQVQTDFEWDQYQKVVDEHDIQKGVMYFKRTGPNVDVAAVITEPVAKKLVFKNGEVQIYTFKTGEIERHDAGKNRKSFESFLALGFGGRGSDLQKNFEIRYAGTETINGKPTYKLELTPKTQEVKNMFPRITLWINQQTGMSEQQKLDQGEGDYRLAKYFSIVVNPPTLPPSAFDLKTK
jgi:hypothetical protein